MKTDPTERVSNAASPFKRRIPLVDVLRGGALVAMAAYHVVWDLAFFDLADFGPTEKPFWIWFARATAGSFLMLVGVGLYLAHGDGVKWRPFLRRLIVIVTAALAISIASWFSDPDGVILFGILHCIAVSSVIGLAFLRVPVPVVIAVRDFLPRGAVVSDVTSLQRPRLAVARARERAVARERLQPAAALVRHGAGRHCRGAPDPAR